MIIFDIHISLGKQELNRKGQKESGVEPTPIKDLNMSLTKLMVSHDFPCSTVTNQIAFDQRDSNTIPEFERAVDCRCQVLVSKLQI